MRKITFILSLLGSLLLSGSYVFAQTGSQLVTQANTIIAAENNYTIPSITELRRCLTAYNISQTSTNLDALKTAINNIKDKEIPYNIVMNINGDPKTQMAFNWFTNSGITTTGAEVQIVQGSGYNNSTFPTPWKTFPATPEQTDNLNYNESRNDLLNLANISVNTTKSYIEYKALATGLTPGATYSFRVGKAGYWSEIGTFTTAKANKDEFSFIYVTDPQEYTYSGFERLQLTTKTAFNQYPDVKFWVNCGDLTESGESNVGNSAEWEWEQFFERQQDILYHYPLAPVIGNHDNHATKNFSRHFNTSRPAFETTSNTFVQGSSYSFVYGDALFFALNSEACYNYNSKFPSNGTTYVDALITWMRAEAANYPDIKWRIVYYHKTFFIGTSDYYIHYDADVTLWRNKMAPIFDELNIDLALEGHEHVYKVAGPLYNQQLVAGAVTNQETRLVTSPGNLTGKLGGTYDTQNGTLHLHNSSVGTKKYIPVNTTSHFSLFTGRFGNTNNPTFSNIKVTADTIFVTTNEVSSSGTISVFDDFKVVKSSEPKTVSLGTQSGTINAGTSGTVSYAVTTSNISNGIYDVSVMNLPTGVSVGNSGKVVISNNSGTLTLLGSNQTVAATTNSLTLTIDGATSGTFTLTITGAKTVSLGTQSGTINSGTAGNVTYAVTTANISNGTYDVSVTNLPTGVSIGNSGKVAISNNNGTLTLSGNNQTVAATTNNLTLTIDGGATSGNFTLTISAPIPVISITAQPSSPVNVTAGSITGSLSVTASVTQSATLSYQWYSNTTNSATGGTSLGTGAHNASYTIPTTLTAGTYYYYCVVSATGGASSVTSNVVTVNVSAAPAIVVSSTGLTGLKVGQTVTGSIVYTLSNAQYATNITISAFNGITGLPAGLTIGTVSRTNNAVVTVAIGGAPTTYSTTSPVTIGYPSSIASGNFSGSTGAITPTGTVQITGGVARGDGATVSQPAAVTVTHNSITVGAVTLTPATGQQVEYAYNQSGTTSPTTGWGSDMTFTGLASNTAYYVWACTVSNTNYNDGTARASAAIRTKSVSLGTQSGILNAGTSGNVTYIVTTANISNGTYAVSVTNLPTGISIGNSGNITINNNSGTLTLSGNNQTVASTTNNLTLTIDGVTSGNFTLTISPPIPVISITAQPSSPVNVTAGSITGSLSVSASVTPSATLSYQWYSNTTNSSSGGSYITGATTASFTIPTNLTSSGSPYYYYCVVSSTGAVSVTSNVSRVNVAVAFIAVTGVTLNKSSFTIHEGGSEMLIPAIVPPNATNQNVTWTSSNDAIAMVNADGTVSAMAAGDVTIVVTTEDGGFISACSVTVTSVTGIETLDSWGTKLYPNPTNGQLILYFEVQGTYDVIISTMSGKILLRQIISDQITELNISNYPEGGYLVVINDGQRQSVTKIVKE